MSQTTSATTGRRYGLERVCRLWEQSRSAFYARRDRLRATSAGQVTALGGGYVGVSRARPR